MKCEKGLSCSAARKKVCNFIHESESEIYEVKSTEMKVAYMKLKTESMKVKVKFDLGWSASAARKIGLPLRS